MRKQAKYTYQKINQDTSKAKHSNTFYWDAKNIRVMSNKEFGAVTNQQGNELVMTLPEILTSNLNALTGQTNITKDFSGFTFPINDLKIIHSEKVDERVILFTTNSTSTVQGVEAIWLLEEVTNNNFTIKLLYLDKLGFNEDSHLESVGINENEESQKVYWVDGVNEVRFINIVDDNIINKEPSEISVTPRATLLDPSVTGYSSGGSHKAGVIQYAYNLYNKFGAQTKISGLSELVALQNDDKGNPLDANINKSPNVQITNIPQNFEYVKVYSIFYSSLNQIPRIALIYENDNTSETLEITDTNDIIQEVSLNEFNIIGTQSIIPKHMTNKDGHLFFGDYKTKKFDVDYDARVFSFLRNGSIYFNTYRHISDKYNNIGFSSSNLNDYNNFLNNLPEDHDLIPLINEGLGYIFGTNELGYSGKNITLKVNYKDNNITTPDTSTLQTSLKRGEKYRVGIVFYNDKDEESFVKWIADIKIPGADEVNYQNILNGDNAKLAYLEAEVRNLPEGVKSYRLVRVKRLEKDKTVKSQGIVNNTIIEYTATGRRIMPDYFIRTFRRQEDEPNISLDSFVSDSTLVLGNKRFDKPIRFQRGRARKQTIDSSDIYNVTNSNLGNNLAIISEPDINRISGEIYALDSNNNEFQRLKVSQNTDNDYLTNISEFNFLSTDILYKKNSLSISTDFKIRNIGFAENISTLSNVSIFALPFSLYRTVYRITEATPGGSASITVSELPKDTSIDVRESFIYNSKDLPNDNLRASQYLFQGDFPDSAVFNYANTEFANFSQSTRFSIFSQYLLFINPEIPEFSTNFTNDGTVSYKVWEFKKSFFSKEFKNIILRTSVSNLDSEILFVPSTDNSILISESNIQKDPFNQNNQVVKESVQYSSNIKIYTFNSTANDHLYFNSLDLYDNLVANFDNITVGEKLDKDYIPIVEFYNNDIKQYGGNTYVDRQRNQYIPFSKKYTSGLALGEYGDTYIQNISLARVLESSTLSSTQKGTSTEVISYIGETSVNNSLRYDLLDKQNGDSSITVDNSFLYNDVYQQESDLIKSLSRPFNFTDQEIFRSEVIASPKKILGEFIDNWTTISINDRITLDTKYGEVTGFAKLNDVLFSFQRNATAYLAINPRVQVQASDNIPIQLGTGRLIERYEYVSTESGTLHPRSIISTEGGIFYFDTLNYSINRLAGQKEEISLTKGLYNYIKDFSQDNYDNLFPINKVVSHYDNLNEEVYFTFNVDNGFTVAYNLLSDGFVSFYDFKPNVYFTINNNMFTVPSDNTIWEHGVGDYNKFYDTYYPSSITLLFNDESDYEKIVDNVSFISNVKENNEDKVNITFNKIKVDNAYQSTGEKDLIIGQNIKRKFREFNLTIPRKENSRDRIRGEYALIKLEFNYPENNYELVLNDSIVSYTIN